MQHAASPGDDLRKNLSPVPVRILVALYHCITLHIGSSMHALYVHVSVHLFAGSCIEPANKWILSAPCDSVSQKPNERTLFSRCRSQHDVIFTSRFSYRVTLTRTWHYQADCITECVQSGRLICKLVNIMTVILWLCKLAKPNGTSS